MLADHQGLTGLRARVVSVRSGPQNERQFMLCASACFIRAGAGPVVYQ